MFLRLPCSRCGQVRCCRKGFFKAKEKISSNAVGFVGNATSVVQGPVVNPLGLSIRSGKIHSARGSWICGQPVRVVQALW